MTCIIGFVKKGTVYMGADSAGASGWNIKIRKDPKIFKKGKFIIGYTTSFRMGQLIRFKMKIPRQPKGIAEYEYMCTLFVDSLRDCFKKGGYVKIENNVEKGGDFLVGYKGKLYHVSEDFQVGEVAYPFNAVGCGSEYALGALISIHSLTAAGPELIIKNALKAAEEFSNGVRGPFVIEKLKRGE